MIRKTITVGMVLLASLLTLSAADSVDELHSLFLESLEAGKLESAIESYEELQKESAKDARDMLRFREEARKTGNKDLEKEAEAYLEYLRGLRMNEAETGKVLSLIQETGYDEYAPWLFVNSDYYRPTLTLDWSTSDTGFSDSAKREMLVQPGTVIHLPTAQELKLPLSRVGLLKGWGTQDGELLYSPGETITMPVDSFTLYAVWTPAVSFFDYFSGLDYAIEGFEPGVTLTVPELDEREGFIFAGWWDRTNGAYIGPDETEFIPVGNGAFYEALWIKLEVTNLVARRYIGSIPSNKPVEFAFVLKNDGTERMTDIKIEFTSDDPLVMARKDFEVSALGAGKEQYITGLNVVADGPGSYELIANVKCMDGVYTWTYPFTITAK